MLGSADAWGWNERRRRDQTILASNSLPPSSFTRTADRQFFRSFHHLLHRRDQFRAAPDSVNKMMALAKEGKIDFKLGQVTGLGVMVASSPRRPSRARRSRL